MTTTSLKETPLVNAHKALNGRMVDFAGWYMPVQYKSIVTEHMATRTAVGLFDVSHMGEFVVQGKDATAFMQNLVPNDVAKMTPGKALYTQLVRPDGGTVDDLIIYCMKKTGPIHYLAIVNASNIDKDWKWFQEQAKSFDVQLENISDATGLLAIQGPKAVDLLADIVGPQVKVHDMGSFTHSEAKVDSTMLTFARTGYTGEDGFEILLGASKTEWLWNLLLEKGTKYGIEPCGLGARDTLRLEAGLPLYGHELTDEISPVESGLEWSVKFKKGDFVGRDALLKQKEQGTSKKIICLKADGKALPRQDYDVYDGEKLIGKVTSGSQGVFVGYPIAFALVDSASSEIGKELSIDIRGKKVPAHVVQRPFYKREK